MQRINCLLERAKPCRHFIQRAVRAVASSCWGTAPEREGRREAACLRIAITGCLLPRSGDALLSHIEDEQRRRGELKHILAWRVQAGRRRSEPSPGASISVGHARVPSSTPPPPVSRARITGCGPRDGESSRHFGYVWWSRRRANPIHIAIWLDPTACGLTGDVDIVPARSFSCRFVIRGCLVGKFFGETLL
jgi:hypothetical protein